jgi:hypothetical protein
LSEKKKEESASVKFSNASAEPRTVVVVGSYATVAGLTVLSPKRLPVITHGTISKLNIELYLVSCL